MEKKVKIVLTIVVLIAVIIALIYTGLLPFPFFELTQPSGKISVVERSLDQYGNVIYKPVSGASVEAVMTIGTFKFLGDLWNKVTMSPGQDGVIDSYDVNYTKGFFGQFNETYADLTGDKKWDIKDTSFLNQHYGWTLEDTKCSNVTQTDGTCTLQYAITANLTFAPPYYNVKVNKSGYHPCSQILNLAVGGQIEIVKNTPPYAVIEYSPQIPLVGQTVTFDGSKSYDTDGRVVSYSWTLTDGSTTKSFSGSTFTYSYSHYGDSVVTLTVTDDLGDTGTTSVTVHVNAINVIAKINANPTSGSAPLNVKFDGSGSYDPDGGNIVSYQWDFGDGSTGTGSVVYHTYYNAGTYTVTLTVTDDEGTIGYTSVTITVYSFPGYASFTYNPTTPYVGETVTFDGSSSTASSGAVITEYHWLINSIQQAVTSSPTWTYSFSSAGSYNVGLYIVDSSGYTSTTTTQTVTVVERPKADFTVSGTFEVNSLLTFTFTGKGSITSYNWDFGDGSTSTQGPTTTHSYSNPGTYTVRLTVSDGRTSDSTSKTVSISVVVQVDCLTPLEFPPSTNVKVKLLAKSESTGQALSNIGLTVMIMPKSEANYAGYTKSGVTGSDGTVEIEILTPPYSKYSPYNMTVSYENKIIKCFDLKVLPQLAVKVISFNYEQVYKPGTYDFSYTGSIVDKETESPVSDFSAYSISLKDEKGTQIPVEYTDYSVAGSSFTFKAKLYDYYKSYAEHTVTLTITFRKTGYIDGTLTATAKMTAPTVMAVVESSSVTVGKNTFTIAFRDKYGQPYAGITEQNIEVIITDPNGVSMSTANELKDKYYFNDVDKAITIVYTFDKVGTYKIVVKYSGLPFYQDPSTFTVTASEAPSPVPSILTNPFVIGFIVLIFLILIFRRRKH
jgi:PKD repeat protein